MKQSLTILLVLLTGCVVPTVPQKPTPPMPPMPGGMTAPVATTKAVKLLTPAAAASVPRRMVMSAGSSERSATPEELSRTLSIRLVGTNVVISWPTTGSDYGLFGKSTLTLPLMQGYHHFLTTSYAGTQFEYTGPRAANGFFWLSKTFPLRLSWECPSANDPYLAGYVIRYGYESRTNSGNVYPYAKTVGSTTNSVIELNANQTNFFFAVTAVATNGFESDFSPELFFRQP